MAREEDKPLQLPPAASQWHNLRVINFNASLDGLREGFDGEAYRSQSYCPVCGRVGRIVDRAQNIHPDRPVKLDLRQCMNCRHAWVDPMPQQEFLSHLYVAASNSVIGVGSASATRTELSIPERSSVTAERRSVASTYFELGVGVGVLYNKFLAQGWDCIGVEPGAWGTHLSGVVPSIDHVVANHDRDVVVAIDVLEHVSDPIDMVRRLAKVAAPGARFYSAFPNVESLRFMLQKAKWRMVRPLGHVHYYSRQSFERVLREGGFSVKRAITNDMARFSLQRPRSLVSAAIQASSYGDQWFVSAIRQ